MTTLTQKQAREIVARIREEYGGITDEVRARTDESVLRALANVRRKWAVATRLLAINLYSSDARFVYEIIQNAEDTAYNLARESGTEPFIIFRVLADKIVVETNEDGFTEADVKGICSTGESSKQDQEGYIGEKGFGFKSVFRIANKVHIQSGPFSFSFRYSRGLRAADVDPADTSISQQAGGHPNDD